MKPEQIFIGNINRCVRDPSTKNNGKYLWSDFEGCLYYEEELYKENAILIKIKNGGYVDIDNINSLLDHIKICKDILRKGRWNLGGIMMPTSPHKINSLFVEYKSSRPYYEDLTPEKKNISVRKLKKQMQTQKKINKASV